MVSALFATANLTGLFVYMFSDPFPTNASKVLLYHLKYVNTICIHLLHILIKIIFLQQPELNYFRNK